MIIHTVSVADQSEGRKQILLKWSWVYWNTTTWPGPRFVGTGRLTQGGVVSALQLQWLLAPIWQCMHYTHLLPIPHSLLLDAWTIKSPTTLSNNFCKQVDLKEEHQPCIWMKRQMEAAVVLDWVWFGIAIVFSWNSFVQPPKRRFVLDFWGAEGVKNPKIRLH